jgi:hypothetical protein
VIGLAAARISDFETNKRVPLSARTKIDATGRFSLAGAAIDANRVGAP